MIYPFKDQPEQCVQCGGIKSSTCCQDLEELEQGQMRAAAASYDWHMKKERARWER
jgi:hypothetical protein